MQLNSQSNTLKAWSFSTLLVSKLWSLEGGDPHGRSSLCRCSSRGRLETKAVREKSQLKNSDQAILPIFRSFFLDPDLWFPSLTPRWKRPFCALPLGPDRVKEPNFFYLESSLLSTGHISPKPQKEKDKTAQSWIPNVVFLFQPVQTTASSIILKLLKNKSRLSNYIIDVYFVFYVDSNLDSVYYCVLNT